MSKFPANRSQIIRSFVACFLIVLLLTATVPSQRSGAKRVRLAVMIAVDGLGVDIFERFSPAYTGGFKRLRSEGLNFSRAMVNHSITISHPGHVTLSSGMNPSHHGIVDAAFYKKTGDRWEYVDAVRDAAERIVGQPNLPGVSGRNITAGTLPEWAVGTDANSRFAAIGTGQYSSLLHAGRMKGDVYWYDVAARGYVTSTYYRQDIPDWVDRFNREKLPPMVEASGVWDSTVPAEFRRLARADDTKYEGYGHTTFPHDIKKESPRASDPRAMYGWFKGTPPSDAATLELAKDAVTARQLGQRDATDYLSIVVSQVDDVSHSYGSGSQEQLDNMLRLDRELGSFFEFLDRMVGKDDYVVAFSADHGMMDIPEILSQSGQPARRVTEKEVGEVIKDVNAAAATATGREDAGRKIAAVLKKYDFIAQVMMPGELLSRAKTADPFLRLQRNSYSSDRVPHFPLFDMESGMSPIGDAGLAVRIREWVVVDFDRGVHGSPYEYDRHVPLIFMGSGVNAGMTANEVHTTDIAPTLASLAGIPVPKGLDGKVLIRKTKGGGR